jgi:hypothetical protein
MNHLFTLSDIDLDIVWLEFEKFHGYSEVSETKFKKSIKNYIDVLNNESIEMLKKFSDEKILLGSGSIEFLNCYEEEKQFIMADLYDLLQFEKANPHSLHCMIYN